MTFLNDYKMANAISAGEDLHVKSAAILFNRPGPFTDEERQAGKVLNYLISYGGGARRIVETFGIPYPRAKRVLEDFNVLWPGYPRLKDDIAEKLETRGYIRTPWGRHLRPDSDHKALNAYIQGSAADLMKAALVKVDGALLEAGAESHIVSVIHDEIILDAIEKELPWLVETVPVLMRDERIHSVVPIDVAVEVARTNWAEKAPYLEVA